MNNKNQHSALDELTSIQLEIEQLYTQGHYNAFIKSSINTFYKYAPNLELFQPLFDLLIRCLNIDEKHIKVGFSRGSILNALGVLCYYNYHYQFAINFYFVAFLKIEKGNHFFYYHNLADALTEMGDYDTALLYFDQAIQDVRNGVYKGISEELRQKKLNLYQLDKIQCLLHSKKIEEALTLYNTIDFSILDQPYGDNFQYVKLFVDFYSKKAINFDQFIKIKQYYYSKKAYRYVLNINRFLLDTFDLDTKEYEYLLIENYTISNNYIIDTELRRKSIVEVIKYYKLKGDIEEMNKYLLHLFEFENATKINYSSIFLNIYLKEISNVFNDLKHVNDSLALKTSELENITHILSHDLKTPLRTIRSFAGLLKKDIAKNDYSRLDEHLGFIRNSSQHLYDLIDDVSLLNKMDRSIEERELIDLNQVAEAIKINLDYVVYKKSASISIENSLPQIKANYAAISILFQNMIENGLKYNDSKNPKVIVSSNICEKNLHISFQDNGIGIKDEFYEKIFELFKRLHTEEKYAGTGFGLGICKKIITAYGGTIEIDSTIGEGSTFIIKLPIEIIA